MRDYLSYSSINLFLTCGEHWRRKYLLNQPQPSTPALIFGSAVHGTIEELIRWKATNHLDGTGMTQNDVWPMVWEQKIREEGDRVEWGADTPEFHFNEGVRLLGSPDVQQMVDGIRPLMDSNGPWIERKIELRVPGVPIPIIGYIDLVAADGVPCDFKTSATRWTQDKAQGEIQPLFYLAGLHQMGRSVPGMRFRHYVMTKTKKPEVQVLEHCHGWDEVFWLYELIRRVWQAIEAQVFPVNPGAWLCSQRYCAYYSDCRGKRWTGK